MKKHLLYMALAITTTLPLQAQEKHNQVVLNGHSSHTIKTRTNRGLTSTKVDYRGTIVFNDTDTDVESISPGGFLEIAQKTFGTWRSALLEGKSDGSIERKYRVGSKVQPWDPDGAQWFADILLDVIRSTGLGAETRVARFYGEGGINALLNEIDEIDGDYVKGIYYSETLSLENITTRDMVAAIEDAAEEMGSDYEKSRLLIKNSDKISENGETLTATLKATEEISSDFEQARVLTHFIEEEELTDAQIALVINASTNISSSYESSRVLVVLVKEHELQNEVMDAYTVAIDDISSDYEKGRVLGATIENQQLSPEMINKIIVASNEMSSDFEQVKVLTKLASQELDNENLELIAKSTDNISSDFETGRLLKAIIAEWDQNADGDVTWIIQASENISSDFEQAKILTLIVEEVELTDDTFKMLVEATDDISSSYEKKRVLSTLIKEGDFNETNSLLMIQAIEDISSNYEKSNLLIALAPKLDSNSEEVKEAFRRAARTITSDHEFGKVMRSVDF